MGASLQRASLRRRRPTQMDRAAGCVDASAPRLSSPWDPQYSLPLPVELSVSGTGDLVTIFWAFAPVQPAPAKWRLFAGPCGASVRAMTILAEGPWLTAPGSAGRSIDSNLPLAQCRAYRLVGVAADGAHDTAPTAEFAFTPRGCSSGMAVCGGICAAVDNNADHCGAGCVACASTVGAGAICQSGVCGCPSRIPRLCGGRCVDSTEDPTACGDACGACASSVGAGATCRFGACQCPGTQNACGGACVDTSADAAHCGASCAVCATKVGTGAVCESGTCRCPIGTGVACGGRCVDQASDPTACGASCDVCATSVGTGATCESGACKCPGSAPAVISGKCIDRAWANWPLPSEPPTSYVIGTGSGSGTVTDIVTGLVWQQPAASTTFTWAAAMSYCANLNLGGFASGSWQLPTRIELLSLVDDTHAHPAINPPAFPNTASSQFYWSSSAYLGFANAAWTVSFDVGYAVDSTNSSAGVAAWVRCVQ
jgi:hypothetical protein